MTRPATRPTRRALLGAASAIAGGALASATAVATDNLSFALDPVIPMVEEAKRLYTEADRLSDAAAKLLASLPEDVQRDPSVMLSDSLEYSDEDLDEAGKALVEAFRRLLPPRKAKADPVYRLTPFCFETQLHGHIRRHRVSPDQAEAWIAEWRADNDRIERAKDEAGYTALRKQAQALRSRAHELVEERLPEMQPHSLAGVIAMIEITGLDDDEPLLSAALDGLREIAAGDVA